ncbi:MAG: diacylglycerol kinase [Methylococcales bacterium]|nr:diacylglycerol kinase [Methylococcales bacterium]
MKAVFYSWAGLKAAWQQEAAFRQEVLLLVFLLPCAILGGDNLIERLFLIACVVLVLIVELINSSVEAVVDRIGTEHHKLSGRAKDIASAAVMLSIIWAAIVWLFILFN